MCEYVCERACMYVRVRIHIYMFVLMFTSNIENKVVNGIELLLAREQAVSLHLSPSINILNTLCRRWIILNGQSVHNLNFHLSFFNTFQPNRSPTLLYLACHPHSIPRHPLSLYFGKEGRGKKKQKQNEQKKLALHLARLFVSIAAFAAVLFLLEMWCRSFLSLHFLC